MKLTALTVFTWWGKRGATSPCGGSSSWSEADMRAVCKSADSRLGAATRTAPTAKLGRLWAVGQGPATATNNQQRPQTASSPARCPMTSHLAEPGIQYQRYRVARRGQDM